MDRYSDRIPVCTEGSGTRYDGRVWYEYLNTIKSVNGVTVDPLKPLEKSDLKHGDRVRVDYEGKIFSGRDRIVAPHTGTKNARFTPRAVDIQTAGN